MCDCKALQVSLDNCLILISGRDLSTIRQDWVSVDIRDGGYKAMMRIDGDYLICTEVYEEFIGGSTITYVLSNNIGVAYSYDDVLRSIPDRYLYDSRGNISFKGLYLYLRDVYSRGLCNHRGLSLEVLQDLFDGGVLE